MFDHSHGSAPTAMAATVPNRRGSQNRMVRCGREETTAPRTSAHAGTVRNADSGEAHQPRPTARPNPAMSTSPMSPVEDPQSQQQGGSSAEEGGIPKSIFLDGGDPERRHDPDKDSGKGREAPVGNEPECDPPGDDRGDGNQCNRRQPQRQVRCGQDREEQRHDVGLDPAVVLAPVEGREVPVENRPGHEPNNGRVQIDRPVRDVPSADVGARQYAGDDKDMGEPGP